jgi:hypothetical protein
MNRKGSRLLLIVAIILTGCQVAEPTAQSTPTPDVNLLPLDTDIPFGEPLVFRSGEVSTNAVELSLIVHPNMKEIYFTRLEVGKATIYISVQDESGWSEPVPTLFSGSYDDIAPFINPDGQQFYFASTRPAEGESISSEVYHIWVAAREGESWGEPVQVAVPGDSTTGENHPSLTREGTLYYMANYPNLGAEGLYKSEFVEGDYQAPEKVNVLTNSPQIVEVEPFISPDESFLLFYSAGKADNLTPGGKTGDLYIAFRNEDGQWNEPQNLGMPINSSDEEAAPTLSPDGKYLFFASNRGSGQYPDIYWVDFSAVVSSFAVVDDRSMTALQYGDLMDGFSFTGPVDEVALTPPEGAQLPIHKFKGSLELFGEQEDAFFEALRGSFSAHNATLPEFNFEFIQTEEGYLVPVQRGLIITEHYFWNIHLEPGRAWQESGDLGYSRASIPFTLSVKGSNGVFNGTLTFLFNDTQVSKVWYQVTQEITTYTRANLWGLLDAEYHPAAIPEANQIEADFQAELAGRIPTKPIEALAVDYPGIDLSAFGSNVTPEHMSWYGVVVNGVNYLGGCQTRFGRYPYCESMRASSYSTAKSAFAAVALMRLVQKYGSEVTDLLIADYVPESEKSRGNWENVTFENALDMATGNYNASEFMVDDNGAAMATFYEAQPFDARIEAAFTASYREPPGTRWVYRTSDTFILMTAMQRYLQSKEGGQADIFQFVVDEVYKPLGIGPGFFSTMRTADDNWQGQPEGGYGLFWTPDDVVKISLFLNNSDGKINGVQILDPGLLAASLQRDSKDRGLTVSGRTMYNNAFWASQYSRSQGYDCDFWVTEMQGISGNVIAFFPNGITYYYFSDNQEFSWNNALKQADFLAPICSE